MSETAVNTRGLPGEVVALPDGNDLDHCIQCGMCTASCPVAALVPGYSPRQLVARTLLGLEDVLSSDEIWYCARCQECVAACKKDIRPGDIITALRILALQRGYKQSAGARHTLAFLASIQKKGKLNEATLPLRTLGISVFKLVPYAMRMAGRGKLPPMVVKPIKGLDEVRALVEEYKR
jgi:heterodisulfide reductase subunit C